MGRSCKDTWRGGLQEESQGDPGERGEVQTPQGPESFHRTKTNQEGEIMRRIPRVIHPRVRFPPDDEGREMWFWSFMWLHNTVYSLCLREGADMYGPTD